MGGGRETVRDRAGDTTRWRRQCPKQHTGRALVFYARSRQVGDAVAPCIAASPTALVVVFFYLELSRSAQRRPLCETHLSFSLLSRWLVTAERGVAAVLHTSPDGKYILYGNGASVIVRSIEVNLAFCEPLP